MVTWYNGKHITKSHQLIEKCTSHAVVMGACVHLKSKQNHCYMIQYQWPLLLAWIDFNPSMDK